MDNVREYKSGDYSEICKWFKLHGLGTPMRDQLPMNGFIVPKIAAGFIYLTDSSVAILDCFIANPDSDDHQRDAAIDLIVSKLTTFARTRCVQLLIANTKIPVIRLRALHLGFLETGIHHSFAKELN